MSRGNRLALLIAAVLILAATGSVLATRAPQSPEQPAELLTSHEAEPEAEDTPPTAAELAHAAERLTEREIPFDDAQLADLAARYGLGGAIRILAWAADPSVGMTAEEIAARRDGDGTAGVGWGRLAKEASVPTLALAGSWATAAAMAATTLRASRTRAPTPATDRPGPHPRPTARRRGSDRLRPALPLAGWR